VQFAGDVDLAARRAKKALAILFLGKGTYRKITSSMPPEDGGEGKEVSLWINPDKNNVQLKREAAGRRLQATVQPLMPSGQKVFYDQSTGILSRSCEALERFNWCEFDNKELAIEWKKTKAAFLKLVPSEISDKFHEV
jgi:hypothetical protein